VLTDSGCVCWRSCRSKYYAYIHRSEVALVESRLVALGNEKADTTRAAYSEKEPLNAVVRHEAAHARTRTE